MEEQSKKYSEAKWTAKIKTTVGDEKMMAFVISLANDGNEDAQMVLAQYFFANECIGQMRVK